MINGKITNLFGGSNSSGNVNTSTINIKNGEIEQLYGGNNLGDSTQASKITIDGGTITDVFGGGNQATNTTSDVEMNNGTVTNIYGGGNQAGLTTSTVNLNGGNVRNAFGGANQSGTVTNSNVTLQSNDTTSTNAGITMATTYTANPVTWQQTTMPTIAKVNVTYTNNTDTDVSTWNSYVYAPGSTLATNYSQSEITESNGKFILNQNNRYYGINKISANGGTYSLEFEIYSPEKPEEFTLDYRFTGTGTDGSTFIDTNEELSIFGGNNAGGETTTSHVNITSGHAMAVYGGNNKGGNTITSNVIMNGGTVTTVYGGNNLGGQTTTANVTINGGEVYDVYGGGNKAITNEAHTNINGTVENCVFGGGNQAAVNTNTELNLNNAIVTNNVYGGGNEGVVHGNTDVKVQDSTLKNSLYAGGNGTTAIVIGNTNLLMSGTSNNVTNSVFGGGNQAATGTQQNNNSISTVNIVTGTIGKNVYGGANTSVVYGYTKVNIGFDAVKDDTLTKGDIQIAGTVFGGGEANASGSENYDYSFISVTQGIDMYIDGNQHNLLDIKGSIFGSGNASSTTGPSHIYIKNYGTAYNTRSNVSIQRADTVVIDNSAIALSGAKDRTNKYSDPFSFSRVTNLTIKNNSILYLDYGANLLASFKSAVDVDGVETLATVEIDDNTGETTRNVDNRLYMLEGRNLNIATDEQVTTYGEVYGMTFFGIYTNKLNPSTSTGLYNKEYNNGDPITNAGTFLSNSYVSARRKTDPSDPTKTIHNIKVDGFYTNYDGDENDEGENPTKGYIRTKYIHPTPPDALNYMWLVGSEVEVTTIPITLNASKYATLGTKTVNLQNEFTTPNTKFVLVGFSAGLANGISLARPADIENISANPDTANQVFGLSMKTSNIGWLNNGVTCFITENGGTYEGSNTYNADNSTLTPERLNFCLYHSENLSLEQDLGNVIIRLQAIIPIDDLNYKVEYIDFDITLKTILEQDDFYEAAITPGEQFSLFNTSDTNITDSSNFSTYYALFIPEFSKNKHYSDFKNNQRVLVSRDENDLPYSFPKNTKFTMIDMVTNKYYYYVVTQNDEQTGKYVYYLHDFVEMGCDSKYYNDSDASDLYQNTAQDLTYENFIFHVDFSENIIPESKNNNSLLMELRDEEDETLIGVYGPQRQTTIYSVYKDKDASLSLSTTIENTTLYRGEKTTLTATTDLKQEVVDTKMIYDTHYFDKKMGIKISIFDNNGNRLNIDSLLGVSFALDDIKYYPRIDGTVRIKIADKVTNVLSKIVIDTAENSTLATGDYTIKVEVFGSPDGIYYGITSADESNVALRIIDSTYGLKISSDDKYKIIDKTTGYNEYGNNAIWMNYQYSSNLNKPSIAVSLYRRKYDDIYSMEYELVDLKDYITSTLISTAREKEYVISNNPTAEAQKYFAFKEKLKTGTYKMTFKLYDDDSYIGETYEYIIIK